ncbi:MAG: hypothetical protein ACTSR8_18850 [Promethearchaeota archaeon]
MIAKTYYFGPKALYDPTFIPPKILHRKDEESALFSLLNDSLKDNFSVNVLYQGIEGIGKKVIINKVVQDVMSNMDNSSTPSRIIIDCSEKSVGEILISVLSELTKTLGVDFNLNTIMNSEISYLWSAFKLACRKINYNLFMVFNNIENLENDLFKKFLNFGKENRFSIISTVNKVLRTSTLDLLSSFDMKKKLRYFNFEELNSILAQRVKMSFPYEIDKQLIEFITDLIFENHVPVPGKGIDILRGLYPTLRNQNDIDKNRIQDLCHNQFQSLQMTDEFDLLRYLADTDVLTILFMDNLSNYFITSSDYYIKAKELQNLYDISCESLAYKKDYKEFKRIIQNSQNVGIISPSKKISIKHKSDFLEYNYYFLLLNPKSLKMMVDTIFNQTDFIP